MSAAVVAQDRTAEFRAAVTSLARIHGAQARAPVVPTPASGRSQFSRKASDIAREIADTTDLLQKLALLAKRKPLFDDKPVEITELTMVIKQKLSSINEAIKALQVQAKAESASGWSAGGGKAQLADHSKNVVIMLQGKLGEVTTGFTEVLEERTRKMQQSRERSEQYITSRREQTPDNPLYSRGGVSSRRSATPHGQGAFASGNTGSPEVANSRSVTPGGPGRKYGNPPSGNRPEVYGENPFSYPDPEPEMLTLPEQQQSLALLEEQQSSYLQSRSVAVDAIESTINELGSIFSQLSTMIAEQRDTVQRIDANTEDIALNVSGAQRELLKYYARISSNRWLVLKSFGVIIVCFLLWVLIS